ncbi:MAG: hypothetical protein QM703_19315 [Gemmatales bacterium]
MARAVQSFDVFDTLITRRSVHPLAVLHQLELQTGIAGLAQARLGADQQLWKRGAPFLLKDLWELVGQTLGWSLDLINRCIDLELQLEREQCIPITCNVALVSDGDLLVSDTYLPAEFVQSLLKSAGLEKVTSLICSNAGKSQGTVWPKILSQVAVRGHFGDNEHSDGKMPTQAGIKSTIYIGARRTPIEQQMCDLGWVSLANLAREVRLSNPFSVPHTKEQYLWNLTCQLNFPLLVLASLCLDHHLRDEKASSVLFVSRDCYLWHFLYQRLFAHTKSSYFYTSRRCLFHPSASYLQYFRSVWDPNSVIVDVSSTGTSWRKFFGSQQVQGKCFFLVHIDNYSYLTEGNHTPECLKIQAQLRSRELGVPFTKGLEMLNYGIHPVVEDVVLIDDKTAVPVLGEKFEYDPKLPQAAHRCFRACLDRLTYYPDLLSGNTANVNGLIHLLVKTISMERHWDELYVGHQEMDAAYMKRIQTGDPQTKE